MSAKMIETPEKLIPAAELRRLRMGSYEDRIEEAAGHVRVLLGEKPFQIVSTFENGVVFFSDGKFHRALFEADGEPSVTSVDVEIFEGPAQHAFAVREAGAIVDLLVRGAEAQAARRLGKLVPAVSATPGDGGWVERIEASLHTPRLWRRVFVDRSDRIASFIGESAQEAEEARLRRQFGKLYDGSIEESNLDSHKNQVEEGLRVVSDRLEQIQDRVEVASVDIMVALSESENPVLLAVGSFTSDLLDDLRAIREAVSNAASELDDVRVRGKLCDTLAGGLHDLEIASRFVDVTAERMVEAS